jgi:hypothetical protein
MLEVDIKLVVSAPSRVVIHHSKKKLNSGKGFISQLIQLLMSYIGGGIKSDAIKIFLKY